MRAPHCFFVYCVANVLALAVPHSFARSPLLQLLYEGPSLSLLSAATYQKQRKAFEKDVVHWAADADVPCCECPVMCND
jgi:hypothetical protein